MFPFNFFNRPKKNEYLHALRLANRSGKKFYRLWHAETPHCRINKEHRAWIQINIQIFLFDENLKLFGRTYIIPGVQEEVCVYRCNIVEFKKQLKEY